MDATQFILLAASRGEGAANRKTEKTGVFSKELRSLLSDENVWPQDWKGIANRLCDRFETLSEARKVSQTPTYFRFLQDGEETRGYTSAGLTDPVNPRRRIFHIAASAAIFAWLCSLFFGEHITFAGGRVFANDIGSNSEFMFLQG